MFHIPAHKNAAAPAAQFDAAAPVSFEPKYEIVDTHTGKPLSCKYRSVTRARARRDYLDSAYGAVRFVVRRFA